MTNERLSPTQYARREVSRCAPYGANNDRVSELVEARRSSGARHQTRHEASVKDHSSATPIFNQFVTFVSPIGGGL
ncbi:hypothetical protein RRG08_037121 [Elysia crispata]|uniref:Uncharacterized protein n=1 Tax=Elysia crispata TaxID=231223 RepID=A0AAE0Y6L1_9GAST|nr:hypothetical protein RRG08_037121 [Elysia crispata]